MNSEDQISILPILLFFWVSSADKDVSQKEIQTFKKLMDRTNWCKSAYMIENIHAASQVFDEYCLNYQQGNFQLDSLRIRKLMQQVAQSYSHDDPQHIEEDLLLFCESIAKCEGGVIGVHSVSREESEAIIVARTLISETLSQAKNTLANSQLHQNQNASVYNKIEYCNDAQFKLRCINVIKEAQDVHTFQFIEINHRKFHYQPGQFITLNLEIDQKNVNRCYTVSSSPSRPNILEVTIKSIKDGLVSNWMKENIKKGSIVNAMAINGEFSCVHSKKDKYLFISAGSGITPVMSMLRYLYDTNRESQVIFLNSCKTQKDMVFKKELDFYQSQMPNMKYYYSLTGEYRDTYKGLKGRISAQTIEQIVNDLHQREVYLCGPDKFKEHIEAVLKQLKFDFADYYYESFGGAIKPAKSVSFTKEVLSKISFNQSDVQSDINNSQSILDCAESAGVMIPNSCRAGVCGTCKIKLLAGNAISLTDGSTIAQGEDLLACCTTSEENIELAI